MGMNPMRHVFNPMPNKQETNNGITAMLKCVLHRIIYWENYCRCVTCVGCGGEFLLDIFVVWFRKILFKQLS